MGQGQLSRLWDGSGSGPRYKIIIFIFPTQRDRSFLTLSNITKKTDFHEYKYKYKYKVDKKDGYRQQNVRQR